jgi:4-diphosphocytidyl-2-C-methyl-D-erythritol kinase
MTATMLRRTAWAKVNLTLHITGRRPDGLHELESLIVFAGVGDGLEFAPAETLTMTISGPFAPAIAAEDAAGNLVLRAARALQAQLGCTAGARMHLEKHLPVAAGIGGGSADAAAALTGLVELWGGGTAALADLAPGLGADVPVCLAGGPSFVTGIGAGIAPVPSLPPAWLVLANPGRPLPTGAVFAARTGPFSPPQPWAGPVSDAADLAARLAGYRNDLEPAARGLEPVIGEVLGALSAADGCLLARMSGSGATCFGLYASAAPARAAAESISARRPDWWVMAAPILGRSDGEKPAGT